jgi:hypothetical protein
LAAGEVVAEARNFDSAAPAMKVAGEVLQAGTTRTLPRWISAARKADSFSGENVLIGDDV